jgi:hypothetical protein
MESKGDGVPYNAGGKIKMSQEVAMAAPCGLYCGDCEHLVDKCRGCGQEKGKPFWAEQYDLEVCPVYSCSVNNKQLEHCGLCLDFHCETFDSLHDPSLSDEEAERALQQRQQDLISRKGIGTEAWLKKKL